MKIKSRYSDIKSVKIDPKNIPAELLHLLPLAKEWCISDDAEMERLLARTARAKKEELVGAFNPHFDRIQKWFEDSESLVPQPDELVMFQMAALVAGTAKQMLP